VILLFHQKKGTSKELNYVGVYKNKKKTNTKLLQCSEEERKRHKKNSTTRQRVFNF